MPFCFNRNEKKVKKIAGDDGRAKSAGRCSLRELNGCVTRRFALKLHGICGRNEETLNSVEPKVRGAPDSRIIEVFAVLETVTAKHFDMSNHRKRKFTTNHTNLTQNLTNTRNPDRIKTIDVKVRVVSG
jgi:hypothetical protein